MFDAIELVLALIEQASWGFQFRLTIQNRSAFKLLLPYPEIHGLEFVNGLTKEKADWSTRLLVSAESAVFVLNPGECRELNWKVRPSEVEGPENDDGSNYYRWEVALARGSYLVSFCWRVDKSFFDPDSHIVFKDLERMAKHERANAWIGEAHSNQVQVVHA